MNNAVIVSAICLNLAILLQTIRAFLFIPIAWLLWIGIVFAATDAIVELIDILVERRRRANLGGLSTAEYAIHVNAAGLRFAALALIFVAKPVEAWSLSTPTLLEPSYPSWLTWLIFNIIPGGFVAALAHVWLMRADARTRA